MRHSLALLVGLLLAACSPSEPGPSNPYTNQVYLPPSPMAATPIVQANPLPANLPAATETVQAGASQACTNSLRFVEDRSIPDGTETQPGQALDKAWAVENNGTCNWDAHYRLKLIAGDALGAPAEQALYPARAGSQTVIHITFIAPDKAGSHRSAWQAFDPQGLAFGDPIFIEIQVKVP